MPTKDYKLADGSRVSGVTTIISGNLGWNKEALKYWAWDQGRNGKDFRATSKEACDAGTIAHAMIEADIKGRSYEIPSGTAQDVIDKGYQGFWNYLKWKELARFEVLQTEVSMVSEEYGYGMTPDCIGSVTGNLAILDYKTSRSVWPDQLIQLAAYGHGWEENFPDKELVGGFHILQIGKDDASFHHHYWDDLTVAWDAFLLCLGLHKLQKILKGKAG